MPGLWASNQFLAAGAVNEACPALLSRTGRSTIGPPTVLAISTVTRTASVTEDTWGMLRPIRRRRVCHGEGLSPDLCAARLRALADGAAIVRKESAAKQ